MWSIFSVVFLIELGNLISVSHWTDAAGSHSVVAAVGMTVKKGVSSGLWVNHYTINSGYSFSPFN